MLGSSSLGSWKEAQGGVTGSWASHKPLDVRSAGTTGGRAVRLSQRHIPLPLSNRPPR